MTGTLIPEKVKDKIVLCDRGVNARVQKGAVVKAAGAVGMILANTDANGEELVADAHLLPATLVGQSSGDTIRNYSISNPNPTATINFEGTKVGVQPDWSPHVTGLAGFLKGAHPDWSPAAIKSALMTTAYVTYKNGQSLKDSATGKPSTPLDHGAGHVDPISALNPGLVYDLTVDDYLGFLCEPKYSPSQINSVARRSFTCDSDKNYSLSDFNYPSFSVQFRSSLSSGSTVVKHSRTLTNVGPPGSYKVTVK